MSRERPKLIGLDVGDKRIGVAVCDGLWLAAAPLLTVHRKNMETDVARLKEIVEKEEAAGIVIGLPKNMDGTEGTQAMRARSLAKQLARAVHLPVSFEDERLSTFEATENLVARGVKTGHNRDLVDMEAAAIILRSYMERHGKDVEV